MTSTDNEDLPANVEDARKVFYSAGDFQMAQSLQQREYEKHAQENKQLRLRVQQSLDQSKEDRQVATRMLREEDEQIARKMQEIEEQEAHALEMADQTIAEELQRQLSVETSTADDEKAAREYQDEEFARYLEEKQMARQKELLERQRLIQEQEARRLQEEEVKRWREEKQRAAQDDAAVAQQVYQSEQEHAQQARNRQAEDEALARILQRREVQEYKMARQSEQVHQTDSMSSLPATLGPPPGSSSPASKMQRRQTSPAMIRSASSGQARQARPSSESGASTSGHAADPSTVNPGVTHLANPTEPGDAVLLPKMNKRRASKKK